MNLHLLTAAGLFVGSFVVTFAAIAVGHLLVTNRRAREDGTPAGQEGVG